MKVLRYLLFLLSFNSFANEVSLIDSCLKNVELLKQANIDDLMWREPKKQTETLPVITLEGKVFPIIPFDNPIVTNESNDRLLLISTNKEKIQELSLNNIFFKKPSATQQFNKLLKSFSVKLSDINCDLFDENPNNPLLELHASNLTLLMTKATFKPPESNGVYRIPQGFVMPLSDTLFIHHAIHNGKASSALVGSGEKSEDIYIYINSLINKKHVLYKNKVLDKFISVLGSESKSDWENLHSSLSNQDLPQETIDGINRVIEHLTRN